MPFTLWVRDNHSYMVGSCNRLFPDSGCPACPACGYRVDSDFTAPNFKLKQKRYDISCCYDGAVIVSQKFRESFSNLEGRMLKFELLSKVPGFFHLKCLSPVLLDYEAMKTQRKRFCQACKRYRDFVGFDQVVLSEPAAFPADGFAFSNKYFGGNNEASPLLIVGEKALEIILKSELKGVDSYDPTST